MSELDFKKISNEDLVIYIKDRINEYELKRYDMEESVKYYKYEHDILTKRRMAIGQNGKLVTLHNLPNNRIVDNQYAKVVNQKVNYLFSRMPLIRCKGDESYQQSLIELYNKKFLRTLNKIALEAYLCGIAWLFVYEENGELKYKKMDSQEIVPIWEDKNHESLKALIRRKTVDFIEHGKVKPKQYVEFYTADEIKTFEMENGADYKLIETKTYFQAGDKGFYFGKIPFIYFKSSSEEAPLLRRCKSLQDAINTIISNFMDNMLEDPRNTILVIKNYDGQNLDEFRNNLAAYGAVKVTSADGMQGGVEALHVNVDSSNYLSILAILKEKLIENARGIDAKNDRMTQAPNQLNIKSMYSDIELDANAIELEFTASLSHLEWFYRKTLNLNPEGEKAEIEFKRNIMVNEESQVNMIRNSFGVLSTETLVGNHPMVDDVEDELKKIKSEKEEMMRDMDELSGDNYVEVLGKENGAAGQRGNDKVGGADKINRQRA